MPIGCFALEIDPNSKPIVRGKYFTDKSDEIKIDDNLILKLRMGHSEKRLHTQLTSDFTTVSYISDYKMDRKIHKLIIAVVLKSTDKAENFRNQVQASSEYLVEKLQEKNVDYEKEMEKIYDEYFETPSVLLNQRELEARLKDRIKSLNKQGKFDEAKEMLDLMKKVPGKLYDANRKAQKAIDKDDIDKAEKELRKAIKYAKELGEDEQAEILKDKLKVVKQRPKLLEKREKVIKKARDNLRKDRWKRAYKYFKEAADISKQLYDTRSAEEYSLKSDALAKFAEIHKRFH